VFLKSMQYKAINELSTSVSTETGRRQHCLEHGCMNVLVENFRRKYKSGTQIFFFRKSNLCLLAIFGLPGSVSKTFFSVPSLVQKLEVLDFFAV
jgi:hypothetical protein